MVHWLVDVLALATSCAALNFIIRAKKTYFLDSRFFMGTANLGFIVILVQKLAADVTETPPSENIYVLMISEAALSVGFASYLLSRNNGGPGLRELSGFLSNPPRSFMAYTALVVVWTVLAVAFQPWELGQTSGPEGPSYYYVPTPWYLVGSSILLAGFILFPVLNMYNQSSNIGDPKTSRAMRIISVSWASFGAVALAQGTIIGTPSTLAQSIGTIVNSLLFIMIAFALREPTVLSRMISRGEHQETITNEFPNADVIVLYNLESDRRKLLEAFARQATVSGQEATCFVARNELPFYTALLKAAVPRLVGAGETKIRVRSLEGEDGIQSTVLGSSRAASELIDFGETEFDQCKKIIQKVRSFDAIPSLRRMRRSWALNVDHAHPTLLRMIRELSPSARTIDLAGHQDSFSSLIGIRHQELEGAKILLECEPSSDYEQLIQKFAREFQANVEPVAIFTSVGSPVYRLAEKQSDIRLFGLSANTSTPAKVSDQEVLLPERDSSLLLDAVDKLLQSHHGRRIGLALDVCTDIILLQGFDKAYGILSAILEMTGSERTTTLILINHMALEERALNGVRGLFGSHVRYGTSGVELVRLHNEEPLGGHKQGSAFTESRPLSEVSR